MNLEKNLVLVFPEFRKGKNSQTVRICQAPSGDIHKITLDSL